MICPICKREMKQGSSVCEFCGYRQVRYCKTCGRMLKSGQMVCPTCEAEKLEAQQEEDILMTDLGNSLQKSLEAELAKMMPVEEEPEEVSFAEPEEELPETIEEIPMMEESEAEEPAEEPEMEEISELPEDPDEDLSLEELYERAIAGKLLDDTDGELFAESLLEETEEAIEEPIEEKPVEEEPVEEESVEEEPVEEEFLEEETVEENSVTEEEERFEEIPAEELFEETPAEELFEETPAEELFEEAPAEELFEETPAEELFEETPVEEIQEQSEPEEAAEEELEELPVLVFPEELFAEEEELELFSVEKEEEELEVFSVEHPKELEVFTVVDGEFPEEAVEESCEEEISEEEEPEEEKPVRPLVKRKEEKRKKPPILLWLLILLVLIIGGIAVFSHFWADDHPAETPASPEETSTEEITPEETTPEETTPEETIPEETTPEETTEPETTVPPTDPYEACVLKGVLTYSNRKYGIRITEGTPFTFVEDRKNVLSITDVTFAGEEEYYGYINQNVTVTGDIAMVDGVPYLYVADFVCKQDQNFIYSEREIHRYELVRADATYEQAAADAAARGGYLARITTEDEFAHVTAQISAQGLSNVRFFVGGTRLEGTQDYYWTYPDGTFTGDLIDDPYSWSGEQWAGGGPSFTDQGRAETAVVLFHYPEESRYAFNDVGRDYLQYDYYYCGYAGYIIEYEN